MVRVVALLTDLMDRSRLTAALPDAELTADVGGVAGADVVIVDLARYGALITSVRELAPSARIVAYGPHVDDAALTKARADGADVVLPRSLFFRDPAAAVARPA